MSSVGKGGAILLGFLPEVSYLLHRFKHTVMIFRFQEIMVMIALLLLNIEHMFTTQGSLRCCDQQSLLLVREDLCLMMEVPLAVLPSWFFQFFQWTMRKRES